MKIKQLQLQNYGRFEDLTVGFAPTDERASNVTVIVGNNGAGKSQILQALGTGLSWFVNGLKNESDGDSIHDNFIKNNKDEANISLIIDFNDNNPAPFGLIEDSSWNISKVRDGKVGTTTNHTKYLRKTFNSFRSKFTNNDLYSFPLIVFYPVERSVTTQFISLGNSSKIKQFEGYEHSLKNGLDFSSFLNWYKNLEDFENSLIGSGVKSKAYSDYKKLLNELFELQQKLNKVKPTNESASTSLTKFDLSKNQLNLYLKMSEILRELEVLELKNDFKNIIEKNQDKRLEAVKLAIEDFTGFTNPRIRRQGTPTMIVEKDGEELDVNQLSQGEKSLLALVGDIARRLAILNPSLDNPLQGEGVVMIDEVDLHLHPKWQHNLIDKLVRTFPNVQFILTTHSPLIVSDRQDILVYVLDNGELQTVGNIYGEDANTLLNDVFDVSARTPEIETEFNSIRRAISNKDLDNAETLINTIAQKVASNNTELLKVRLMLAQAKLAQHKAS